MKELGEISEIQFLLDASKSGLSVCVPWGDNQTYDFIVISDKKITRVQVKSTAAFRCNRFTIKVKKGHRQRVYDEKDFDVLAAYIVPEKTWYFIPKTDLHTVTLHFYPHREKEVGLFKRYRMDWEIFK